MKELVITRHGSFLKKESERFVVQSGDVETHLPAVDVSTIQICCSGAISTEALRLAARYNIPVYVCDNTGEPVCSVLPSSMAGAVTVRIRQLEARSNPAGCILAKRICMGSTKNKAMLLRSLARTRQKHREDLLQAAERIDALRREIADLDGELSEVRRQLLPREGMCASIYFAALRYVLSGKLYRGSRSRQPPRDLFNAGLSYGYGILYPKVHRAVILAGLDPYLGFLHSEYERRPGLVMDLIEEFRQTVVDREIIKLCVRRRLQQGAIGGKGGFTLGQEARRAVASAVLDRLHAVGHYRGRKEEVNRVILLQATRLANHLLGRDEYRAWEER